MRTSDLNIVSAENLVNIKVDNLNCREVDLVNYGLWQNTPTRLVLELDTSPDNLLRFASWLILSGVEEYHYLVTNNPSDDEWDACFVLLEWK